MKSTTLNVLDLFSGIGGFSRGLETAGGFKTVAFCEIEEFCQRVLKKHWPDVPIYNDVRNLKHDGPVDVVCGGFPCQDISIAGKNDGGIDGERSGLWREFAKIIRDLRPRFAIVENVSALSSRGIYRILGDLAALGYDATWATFDSQYFGLPQRRRRIYILAVRDGITAGTDIFRHKERTIEKCGAKIQDNEERRFGDIEEGKGERDPFAFFTRQRSDQFIECGLSSTLAKRDYKSYTDLVMQNGVLRRVVPEERMMLQGFPSDWLDGIECTEKDKFSANGMSVNVVKFIGECINAYI